MRFVVSRKATHDARPNHRVEQLTRCVQRYQTLKAKPLRTRRWWRISVCKLSISHCRLRQRKGNRLAYIDPCGSTVILMPTGQSTHRPIQTDYGTRSFAMLTGHLRDGLLIVPSLVIAFLVFWSGLCAKLLSREPRCLVECLVAGDFALPGETPAKGMQKNQGIARRIYQRVEQ
jgi:hypothetical protein